MGQRLQMQMQGQSPPGVQKIMQGRFFKIPTGRERPGSVRVQAYWADYTLPVQSGGGFRVAIGYADRVYPGGCCSQTKL